METKRFFESEYVNVEAVRNAQKKTATILNAGIPETTQYGERFVLRVQFAGDVRKYAPNKVSWQNIANAWGTISESWVERTIRFEVEIDRKNNRERVVAYPVDTTPKIEEVKEGD